MPLYTLACKRPLPQSVREAVTSAITQTHCEVTDAPPEFVNVIFMDGYSLKNGWRIGVVGGVRSGGNRNPELIKKLHQALLENICSAAKLPIGKVGIELVGVKANWVMEGGKILPEPGEEDNWMKKTKQ